MKKLKSVILPSLLALTIVSACSDGEKDAVSEAQSAFEENKFQEARIFLLNHLREDPTNPEGNALYARVMLELGDGDSAQTALSKLPTDFEDIRALKAQALILKERGNDVLKQYRNVDRSTFTAQDWRMLIWAKFSMKDYDEAYTEIQSALEKFPNNSDLLSLASEYHLEKGNNTQAIKFADKAIENEENYQALNIGAKASLRSYKIDLAQKYYERSAKSFPDNPTPIINLAGIAMDKNDLDLAKTYLENAERLDSALPLTKFIKARYLNMTGDNEAAKDILQDSNSGLEDFGPAIFLAGKIAFELGEMTVARSRLNRSLAFNPHNQEAKQLLSKIP